MGKLIVLSLCNSDSPLKMQNRYSLVRVDKGHSSSLLCLHKTTAAINQSSKTVNIISVLLSNSLFPNAPLNYLCSVLQKYESDFSAVKSQLFTTPDQCLGFSTEKQYFRFLLLFFYYAFRNRKSDKCTLYDSWKSDKHQSGLSGWNYHTRHLIAGSLHFWPILYTIFCAVFPSS